MPIWVADYVLMGYGTGSIMAVPGHDQRDFEFSKEFELPIQDVIYPPIVLALKYFAEHAPQQVRGEKAWRPALAEFLYEVAGTGADPDGFELALQVAVQRSRKQSSATQVAQLYADPVLKQLPSMIERKLGNNKVKWLDVFQTLGIDSLAELIDRFKTAEFYSRIGEAFADHGYNVNSPPDFGEHFTGQSSLNNKQTPAAKLAITDWLESCDLGEGTVQYKLRDWLFSRQRYWGEPFPILLGGDDQENPTASALGESELPVTLPELEDFKPAASDDPNAPISLPLSKAAPEWRLVQRAGQTYRRELNTMPQWAGSCWYYLRFCDAGNKQAFIGSEAERYWLGGRTPDGQPLAGGVDLYMGGAEHAVLHLLYARFWHKVLYDLGHVSTPEPFQKLFNQGMLTAYAYQDSRGVYIHYDDIVFRDDGARHKKTDEKLIESVAKMSKALKNVINPDRVIEEYGADTLRLYEMYMGPLEASKPWNPRDIIGVHRFLQRLWRLIIQPLDESEPEGEWRVNPKIVEERNEDLERLLHKTIKKVAEDIQRFALNTAIAQMIVWVNEAGKAQSVGRDQCERFLQILSPFAPHLCEELWERLGHRESLVHAPWPKYNQALTQDETIGMAIQVNGKLKARIQVPAQAGEDDLIATAKENEAIASILTDKQIKRVIVVPGRLLNLIVA